VTYGTVLRKIFSVFVLFIYLFVYLFTYLFACLPACQLKISTAYNLPVGGHADTPSYKTKVKWKRQKEHSRLEPAKNGTNTDKWFERYTKYKISNIGLRIIDKAASGTFGCLVSTRTLKLNY
jgi:hypothetical protein